MVLDYKTTKLSPRNDWETVKSKYEDIVKLFTAHYPVESSAEFPNAGVKGRFTNKRVASKIKKLKLGFPKSIDSRKKSGGGQTPCIPFVQGRGGCSM